MSLARHGVATCDQLAEIFTLALSRAKERCVAGLRCEDLMPTEATRVEYGTSLEEVWSFYRQHKIPEIPVVDRALNTGDETNTKPRRFHHR